MESAGTFFMSGFAAADELEPHITEKTE
jgi:hypothetical protein